jgi:hypothetical protein
MLNSSYKIKLRSKICGPQQAKIVNLSKNTKDKPLRTNAAIWYYKVRWAKHLAPKYAQITIKDNAPRNVATMKFAIRYGEYSLILQERIKVLYSAYCWNNY